jgi:spermidine synthase
MAGAAAGSAYATRQLDRLHNPAGAIIAVESLSCIYCYVVSVFVLADFTSGLASGLGFAIIFFGAGFILGLEFPLASRILLDKGRGAGATSGLLYGLDLAGACLAGLTAGVILLPLFGFSGSLLLTACLKLGSLAFMLAAFKRG